MAKSVPELEQLYKKVILDHNRCPRNRGPVADHTHAARGHDALCGDDIRVELHVLNDRIQAAGFSGEACAVTTASASMMTSWVLGRSVDEAIQAGRWFRAMLDDPDGPIVDSLGDLNHLRTVGHFPARIRNALLPWRTLESALDGQSEMNNLDRKNPS